MILLIILERNIQDFFIKMSAIVWIAVVAKYSCFCYFEKDPVVCPSCLAVSHVKFIFVMFDSSFFVQIKRTDLGVDVLKIDAAGNWNTHKAAGEPF